MRVTAVVAATAFVCVQGQLVCDMLPGMVNLDIQNDPCCGATIAIISAGAIMQNMGALLGDTCRHMISYAEYFPDGCTDCTEDGDDQIPNCYAGSSPSLVTMAAASTFLC
jgi:hypothetical protein